MRMSDAKWITIPDLVVIVLACPLVFCLAFPAHAGDVNKDRTIYPLVKVLADSGVSGSMEISGACERPELPFSVVRPTVAGSKNVVDVMKTMLQQDSSIEVNQDRDGTVRIKERDIPEDILKVKIHELKFGDSAGLYVPDQVVLWIMAAPEMDHFRKSHGIEWSPIPIIGTGNFGPALTRLPHISESLHDVTVSQVLDFALKTFPGIWIYKNCPAHEGKKRIVYLRFFNMQKIPPEYLQYFAGERTANGERSH